MFRILKYLGITLASIIAGFLVIAFLHDYAMNAHYSDQALVEAFYSNRQSFEQLESANEDESTGLTLEIRGRRETLSIDRTREMIDLCCASFTSTKIDEYEAYTSSKGYVFSDTELFQSEDSLDHLPTGKYYRRLDGNWYIYISNGYSKPE